MLLQRAFREVGPGLTVRVYTLLELLLQESVDSLGSWARDASRDPRKVVDTPRKLTHLAKVGASHYQPRIGRLVTLGNEPIDLAVEKRIDGGVTSPLENLLHHLIASSLRVT